VGAGDTLVLNINPGYTSPYVGAYGVILQAGSAGLRCMMGKNVVTGPNAIVAASGSGPNYINGTSS
jgi:hypothetical protein